MHRRVLILSSASAMLAGCGSPFLHPAATGGAPVHDAGLAGEWATDGPTVSRVLVREDEGRYDVSLTVRHEGETRTSLELDLSLTDIGGARYADLFLDESERDRLVGTYGFLVVPVHQTVRIARAENELRVWFFDGAWLERKARAGALSDDRVVIGHDAVTLVTAPAEEVRAFIARHAGEPGAFGEPVLFRRVGP